MGNGVRGNEADDEGIRPTARWWVLATVVVASGLIAWWTTSLGTAIELVAVLGVLLGVGVAFGAHERRPRRGSGLVPPGRPTPDERVAARAAATLASVDRIEHRRIEVGAPWPQLLVGPTGAVIVDLCRLDEATAPDAVGTPDGEARPIAPCPSCREASELAATVRQTLDARAIDLPVRSVAVVADDTGIVPGDLPEHVSVVRVDQLVDALSRGPVLPMDTVEAAFEQLARTVASERSAAG